MAAYTISQDQCETLKAIADSLEGEGDLTSSGIADMVIKYLTMNQIDLLKDQDLPKMMLEEAKVTTSPK